MTNPNLIDKFYETLPPAARPLVDRLVKLADDKRVGGYLVGGPVRDLILGRASFDLDITVEGDASSLARALATGTGGRAVQHATFGTATVMLEDITLDLATARTEAYLRPGALPTVRPATIRDDLLRRDFTINALALHLNGPCRGNLLDPAQGQRDLAEGFIRVLHERSFQDDATRILRAVRYACRFGFTIQRTTSKRLKRDAHYLNTISGARLHHEFVRIFAEDAPESTLRRLDELGALQAIHPALRLEQAHAAAFATIRRINPASARSSYWPLLGWQLALSDAASLPKRLVLTKAQSAALEAMHSLEALEQELDRRFLKRSALLELLAPFPAAAIWAFAAVTAGRVRERCLEYLTKLHHVRPILRGDDILALGALPGPQVGEVLRRLKPAKLDGEVRTRRDEERLARRLVKVLSVRPEALEG